MISNLYAAVYIQRGIIICAFAAYRYQRIAGIYAVVDKSAFLRKVIAYVETERMTGGFRPFCSAVENKSVFALSIYRAVRFRAAETDKAVISGHRNPGVSAGSAQNRLAERKPYGVSVKSNLVVKGNFVFLVQGRAAVKNKRAAAQCGRIRVDEVRAYDHTADIRLRRGRIVYYAARIIYNAVIFYSKRPASVRFKKQRSAGAVGNRFTVSIISPRTFYRKRSAFFHRQRSARIRVVVKRAADDYAAPLYFGKFVILVGNRKFAPV